MQNSIKHEQHQYEVVLVVKASINTNEIYVCVDCY